VRADLGALTVGLMTSAPVSTATASALAVLSRTIVDGGGSVLIPESDPLLADLSFRKGALESIVPHATLLYGQPPAIPGLHVVASETDHWVENLTGLGGCGAHLVLTVVGEHARQGHPMLPVVQVAESSQRAAIADEDIDLFLTGDAAEDTVALEKLLVAVAERTCTPLANAQGFVDFQFTRGLLGVTS